MDDLAAENKILKERLLLYRRYAALMLADWWAVPAAGFKEKMADRHMKMLRKLIRGDLITALGEAINPPKNWLGGRPKKG